MNESEFKTAAVKLVRKVPNAYAHRIEDKFGVGFPDVIVKLPEFAWCFIEAKIVRGRYFSPTPRQLIELQRISLAGNCFALMHGVDLATKTLYFDEAVEKVDTTTCFQSTRPFPQALRDYLTWLTTER